MASPENPAPTITASKLLSAIDRLHSPKVWRDAIASPSGAQLPLRSGRAGGGRPIGGQVSLVLRRDGLTAVAMG
jgi:hypothetical protein